MDVVPFIHLVFEKVRRFYDLWLSNSEYVTMEVKRDATETLDKGIEALKKPKLDLLVVDNKTEESRMSEEEKSQNEGDDELIKDIIRHYFQMPLPSKDPRYDVSELRPEKVELLDPEDLPHQMRADGVKIQEKLEISSAKAFLLLHHFKWDAQNLLDMYFGDNFEQYFTEQGLPHKFLEDGNRAVGDLRQECGICFMEFTVESQIGMGYPRCHHYFCTSCYFKYFKMRILEQGLPSLQCPEPNCHVLLDENYIKGVISPDSDIVDRYDLLVLNEFVLRNKHFKYCPAERCSKIWKMDVDGVPWYLKKVTCNCEKSYCFSCTNQWHFPLPCNLIEDWNARVQKLARAAHAAGVELTLTWIQQNTKPCPGCSTRIQKIGGCNHMICINCRSRFDWSRDTQPTNDQIAREEVETAGAQTTDPWFQFNGDKFLHHDHSFYMEKQLLQQSEDRMTEIRTACCTEQWSGALFYKTAINQILECRTLLKYSFAFVFHLEPDPKSEIFNTTLINLSNAVDELSRCLKPNKCAQTIADNKMKIVELTNFCEQRLSVLIDLAHEGYLDEKWCWSFRQVPNLNS